MEFKAKEAREIEGAIVLNDDIVDSNEAQRYCIQS